jgi:hypothetical protein
VGVGNILEESAAQTYLNKGIPRPMMKNANREAPIWSAGPSAPAIMDDSILSLTRGIDKAPSPPTTTYRAADPAFDQWITFAAVQ